MISFSGAASDLHDPLDRIRFPIEPWKFTEAVYSTADLGVTETLFAVGNGYLGMRGNVEEGRDAHSHGTYINGFHETWSIHHAEDAFGFAKLGQTIVNVPDAKLMKLYVDDEPLLLANADLEAYERTLDLRDGVLTRDLVWRTPASKRVRVRTGFIPSTARSRSADGAGGGAPTPVASPSTRSSKSLPPSVMRPPLPPPVMRPPWGRAFASASRRRGGRAA